MMKVVFKEIYLLYRVDNNSRWIGSNGYPNVGRLLKDFRQGFFILRILESFS
jgi:hypothetical protein